MATRADDPTAKATDLLRDLIRNQCVNDGRIESGQRPRASTCSATTSRAPASTSSATSPTGRSSLVTRIEGSDPQAPSLLLMGHTDVVPVNPDGRSRDPFGAEIVDRLGRRRRRHAQRDIHHRARVRRLADSGFKPRGTLTYLAVAEEEALGTRGAKWLVDNERDAVYADYVLTESGIPDIDVGGRPSARHGRREGHVLVEAHGARDSRAQVTADSAPTTPSSRRPRSCGASTNTGPRPGSTTPGAASSRACSTHPSSVTPS